MTTERNRRRREKRPKRVTFIACAFLLMPIYNILILSYYYKLSPAQLPKLLFQLNYLQLSFLFGSIIVGLGLLLIKKWSWYIFLGYTSSLIMYNIYGIISFPARYNYLSLIETTLLFVAMFYFLRRDIYAPYKYHQDGEKRGFRREKRQQKEVTITIQGKKFTAENISRSGFYVKWKNCPYKKNDLLKVITSWKGLSFLAAVGIVRIDNDGVAMAYRNLSSEDRLRLKVIIKDDDD